MKLSYRAKWSARHNIPVLGLGLFFVILAGVPLLNWHTLQVTVHVEQWMYAVTAGMFAIGCGFVAAYPLDIAFGEYSD